MAFIGCVFVGWGPWDSIEFINEKRRSKRTATYLPEVAKEQGELDEWSDTLRSCQVEGNRRVDCAAFQSVQLRMSGFAFSPYPSDSYRIRRAPQRAGKEKGKYFSGLCFTYFPMSSSVSWPPNCSGNCRKKNSVAPTVAH